MSQIISDLPLKEIERFYQDQALSADGTNPIPIKVRSVGEAAGRYEYVLELIDEGHLAGWDIRCA
ncbi:hypothetical protein [Paenibacillus xanthanilyticus]|uniref:Uncharacterized protein n=1 Tax=Paenibacillus xanthanilyticus TaxID=1783531 RepID=A0ABV8K5J6_9BACL